MDDSFFGFDTSVPCDDNGAGGQIAEPSEEEYDALNDETFGSATNGDWEEAHETMVRLTDGSVSVSSNKDSLDGVKLISGNILKSSQISSPSKVNISRTRYVEKFADSDLELNLSAMKLDDVDLRFDDNESLSGSTGINLDPSVWATNPFKSSNIALDGSEQSTIFQSREICSVSGINNVNNSDKISQQAQNANLFAQHIQSEKTQCTDTQMIQRELPHHLGGAFGLPPTPKFCTLEDIERNIIIEQSIRKNHDNFIQPKDQRNQHHQNLKPHIQQHVNDAVRLSSNINTNTPPPQPHHMQQHQLLQHQINQTKSQVSQLKGPPGFPNQGHTMRPNPNFANNLTQHPLGNIVYQQQTGGGGNRLPPGFSLYSAGLSPHVQQQNNHQLHPHPILNQHGLPPNFPRPLPSPHLPIALNNFAMHPNFNAMRAAAAVAGIHPASLIQTPQTARISPHPPNSAVLLNSQQSTSMYNMFNMRLVQEIQQNHPLLQNVARQTQQLQQNIGMNSQQNLVQQRANVSGINKPIHQRRDGGSANGNLPHEEFDQYANLMSTRDKHWLIGIQLSQLNTDTPYIDDFYYTVYRERKAVLNGDFRHSQAHKDNQLNHPLTQPKGHAQLILVQLGNKNGTRNGQHRERRNSESTGTVGINSGNIGNSPDQKAPYVFSPLKFENSLGKLQYGSVTAPRKIIDAEIMGNENLVSGAGDGFPITASYSGSNLSILKSNIIPVAPLTGAMSDFTSSVHRKSRHILLHIETLYRIVLKLEDLNNPTAIATIIMKKKKESERIAALEQIENASKSHEERMAEASNSSTVNPALKNKFTYEIEKKETLVAKLIAGLSQEEVAAIMNVRKGKTLIRRIMIYIETHDIRWTIWMGVFSSLQNVVKKDKDDADGVLYALYPEFKNQVRQADFETIVRISASIPLSEKKFNGIFCSKFGISSLVCLVLQAENIYMSGNDCTLTNGNKGKWRYFLDQVATSLNRTIQNHTVCAEIESDSIQPLMNHFARFEDLKLDSLLALITQARQQIN